MACVVLILAAVLTSTSIPFLGGLFVALCALILLARVPLGPALLLACYPVLFSSLFLLSRWDGTWQTPALLLLRSLTSSLSAVLLVATTPYPDLFAPIARVTPRILGDGLFLTYRAFFALLSRAERMWVALRLRGGLSGHGLISRKLFDL
jgi:energy-coupling factor transporter transmembrane protein EcfT